MNDCVGDSEENDDIKVVDEVSGSKTEMDERTLDPVGDTVAFLVWLVDTVIRDAVPLSTGSAVTTLPYLSCK